MTNETILLSRVYTSEKDLILPAQVTEKLDGVPVDIYYKRQLGAPLAQSRQGKPIKSIQHILDSLVGLLPHGAHLIGELYIEGMDFKDISGLARKQETNEDTEQLVLHIHDYYMEGKEDTGYVHRMLGMLKLDLPRETDFKVVYIKGKTVHTPSEFQDYVEEFFCNNPEAEGVIIRALYGDKSVFKKGWRSPGMLKLKRQETIDLKIHSFDEAIDKNGNPKGMVGRINVVYPVDVDHDDCNTDVVHGVIGVGPGALNHKQRKEIWENSDKYIGKTIEIKYMPDDSYNALREARFFRFREDKDD